MLFPTGDAYMLAVQNAWTAFQDADLKRSAVELTPLGLPKPYSGGFATTFRFSANGAGSAQWAVRCFKQDLPDLPRRYAAMQRLWARPTDPLFVRAGYLPQGIRVGQNWYPVVKMDWVEGDLLGPYIQERLYKPAALLALAEGVRQLAARLEGVGVAHGDLQHGNIIIQDGRLRLIDYDGMFLPELMGMGVAEIGHVNFQHPGRSNQHYGPHLDRFAVIVLYLGLQALSKQPSLWRKYDNGDNLLFRQSDFIDPAASPLLADLAGIAGLKTLVERFHLVCRDEFDAIPNLDVFLAGSYVAARPSAHPPRPPARMAVARHQYPVVDAANLGALSEYVGSRVEVTGRISQYFSGRTEAGAPFLFLNFGDYPKRTLTVVVWARVLKELQSLGVDPLAYVGKPVRVTGVLAMYDGRPQMELESAGQIRVIVGDAHPADGLPPLLDRDPASTQPVDGRRAHVLNTLYQDWPIGSGAQVEPPLPTAAPRQPTIPPKQPGQGKPPAPPAAQPAPPAAKASAAPASKASAPVASPPTATIHKPKPQVDADSDCFVATVAFAGPAAVEVQILRRFRDRTLSRHRLGRAFIAVYYRYGPRLADFIQARPQLRQLTAALLARLAAVIAAHQPRTPVRT